MTNRPAHAKQKWLRRGIITGLFLVIVSAASAWHFSQPIAGLENLVTERLAANIHNAGGQFTEIQANAAAREINIDSLSIDQPDGAGHWAIEKLTISGIQPQAFRALTTGLPQRTQAASASVSAQTFCSQVLAKGIKFIAKDGSTLSVANLKLNTIAMTQQAQEAQFNQLLTHPEALFAALDIDAIEAETVIWTDSNNAITTQAARVVIAPYQAGLISDLQIASFTHQPGQAKDLTLLADTIALKNIDLRNVLEVLITSHPGGTANVYNQVFAQASVGAIEATQLHATQNGRSMQVAKLNISDIKRTGDKLTHAHTHIKNAQIAVADLAPDAQKQFADLGYDTLRFSMESLFTFDPTKR